MTKENTKQYWFAQKRYGWGWGMPITWQGWLVVAAHMIGLVVAGLILLKDAPEDEWSTELTLFFIWTVLQSGLLIYIGYKKGPKPKWRWGDRKK